MKSKITINSGGNDAQGTGLGFDGVVRPAPEQVGSEPPRRNTQPVGSWSKSANLQTQLQLFCRVLSWMMFGLGALYFSLVPGGYKLEMVAVAIATGVGLWGFSMFFKHATLTSKLCHRFAWGMILMMTVSSSIQYSILARPFLVFYFSMILLGSAFILERFVWHVITILTVSTFWLSGSLFNLWPSFQSDVLSAFLMSVFVSVIIFELRRKEVESIHEVSSKHRSNLLELTSDVVQHIASDGTILFVNQNWLDKLGYDEAELEGLNIFELIPEVHHRRFRVGLEKLNKGAQMKDFSLPLISKGGNEIMFCGNVLTHVDPELGRWNEVFLRDMTEVAAERESFLRFVPKAFLNLLGKDEYQNIELGDHVVGEVTVLYADLRNFTRFAEKLTPNDLFYFLNSYFGRMQPVVEQYGGVIDKYLGDGILAVFPPMRNSNHTSADRAVLAAHTMVNEMERFNTFRRNTNRREIGFGIGVNTGVVMMGTVGTHTRMDTTVVGHAVNVAARLEQLTKEQGHKVLISGASHDRLSSDVRAYVSPSGETYVRGLEEPVRLFTLRDQKWWDSRQSPSGVAVQDVASEDSLTLEGPTATG